MAGPAPSTQHAALVPDFVICGNVVRDVLPDGWAPGGTVVYAAAVAHGLGRSAGVITAAPADVVAAGLPPDVPVARAEAPVATSYENMYAPHGRTQYLRAAGSPIPPETAPAAWLTAPVVLLGPVYHEVSMDLAARFEGSIGVCGQGFLRRIDVDGRVTVMPPEQWDALPLLHRARVLFLSEEDVTGGDGHGVVPQPWLDVVETVVLTAGPRGARVHTRGRWQSVPAFLVEEVDPTGAGDSFAAAFMIALDEGTDPVEAARFAAVLASFTVEAHGPQSPSRDAVAQRLNFGFQAPGSMRTRPEPGVWSLEPGTARWP